jgi:hypothetical protein
MDGFPRLAALDGLSADARRKIALDVMLARWLGVQQGRAGEVDPFGAVYGDLDARPGLTTGLALLAWDEAAPAEGVSGGAMAAAREALAWVRDEHADSLARPDDDELVVKVALAWQRHARSFLDRLGPVPWPEAGATVGDLLQRFARAYLATAYTEGSAPEAVAAAAELVALDGAVASLAVEGMPWLSDRFGAYLAELDAKLAEGWLPGARPAASQSTIPAPGMPPAPALPGWLRDGSDTSQPAKASRAELYLALAVWRAEVRPELEPLYPTSAMLLPLAQAFGSRLTAAHGDLSPRWKVSVLAPELLRLVDKHGALHTTEAIALVRKLPDLARLAHNADDGRTAMVWSGPEGALRVTPTSAGRTEVEAEGGWQVLAAYLGYSGGDQRTAIRNAGRVLAELPYRWHAATRVAEVEGTTTLVADLEEHEPRGSVSFMLPRLWWPGFSAVLQGDPERAARARVPIDPTPAPTTSPKLGSGADRLELRAAVWIREHIDTATEDGAPVPWEALADEVGLSTASQRIRRRAVLEGLLELWVDKGRWSRTADRWRPSYGWSGPGGLLEAKEQRERGQQRQARSRKGHR